MGLLLWVYETQTVRIRTDMYKTKFFITTPYIYIAPQLHLDLFPIFKEKVRHQCGPNTAGGGVGVLYTVYINDKDRLENHRQFLSSRQEVQISVLAPYRFHLLPSVLPGPSTTPTSLIQIQAPNTAADL